MRYPNKYSSKYKAKKTECLLGHIHDSKKEAERCNELNLLLKANEIREIEYQKKFLLIPALKKIVKTNGVYKKGVNKGKPKEKEITEEKAVYYKADFYYYDNNKESYIIEDTKGMKTKEYIIKRKLVKSIYCKEDSNTQFLES